MRLQRVDGPPAGQLLLLVGPGTVRGQDLVPWAASTAERWELSLERAIVQQEATAELRRS